MAKCPKCGAEVSTPIKEWDVIPKGKKGPKLHVQLFEHCGKKFRLAHKVD
ncbi:MAG: chorismate-binding protein [Candidatus Bathyarchaeia archaeon]